jgi:hypothetical protein
VYFENSYSFFYGLSFSSHLQEVFPSEEQVESSCYRILSHHVSLCQNTHHIYNLIYLHKDWDPVSFTHRRASVLGTCSRDSDYLRERKGEIEQGRERGGEVIRFRETVS